MLSSLVSICIPCHNAAPFVGAALDSALAQTWPNLEIIVVNDGSTDESSAVLATYADRGVKIITEKCGSAAKARNRALQEAPGDYIKFFDADDLMNPEFIERQMARLAGRSDAVASSEWGRFYGDDLTTLRLNPQSVWRDMESTEWLVEAWRDARPMMQPGMFLIPASILRKAGGWDESLTLIDDFEFFARVLCHANEVLFTPGAVLSYRSGLKGSLSGQKSRRAVESAYHSLLKGTGHLLARRQDADAKRSCANLLQDFIHTYYPDHADLRHAMKLRVEELGGSDLSPDGPPRFQKLRRLLGWRLARRVQQLLKS
jgi:glycosyltransferase involved in cell wall biosynthesis